jgi:hypothetical protein
MTGSNIDHMDVGAYALGVLADWEASQFEMHLAGCPTCAHELEELTLVSGLLSHVDGNSIAVVEEYGRDGRAFDRMVNVVSMERRRARTRRVMSMAAAFVLVVGGVAYGLFGSSPFDGSEGGGTIAGRTPASVGPSVGIFRAPRGHRRQHRGQRHDPDEFQCVGESARPHAQGREGPARVPAGRGLQVGQGSDRHELDGARGGLRHDGPPRSASVAGIHGDAGAGHQPLRGAGH